VAADPPLSADPFAEALAALRRATEDLNHMATKLADHRIVPEVDTRKWPKPGPPLFLSGSSSSRPRPNDPTSDELWAKWQGGGLRWLKTADRRTLRVLCSLLTEPTDGRRFREAPKLLRAVLDQLRPNAAVEIAGRLYLAEHPPLRDLVGWRPAEGTSLPRWWEAAGGALPPPERFANVVAEAIQAGEALLPADLDLGRLEGRWEAAIATARPVRTADHAEALLHFLDGGPITGTARGRPGAAVAIRALVAATENGERNRRDVGHRLSLRFGSPFGGDAGGRWSEVSDLLPKVKAWLAGEVLEVVFEHLRPEEFAHHLEPRKEFWKRYTGSVVRMWVAVSDAIKNRHALEHRDVLQVRAAMGSDLSVLDLEGGAEQALVWMHLQAAGGKLVTVVEGNASTKLRITPGCIAPPPRRVRYHDDVMHGRVAAAPHVTALTHHNGWEEHAERALRAHQVYPT
jgi:hypothetical protein